jgi:hypothetical protein
MKDFSVQIRAKGMSTKKFPDLLCILFFLNINNKDFFNSVLFPRSGFSHLGPM